MPISILKHANERLTNPDGDGKVVNADAIDFSTEIPEGTHVGIGITPNVPLHIGGTAPEIRLEDIAGSYGRFQNPSDLYSSIEHYSASGISELRLDPVSGDGVSVSRVRFFRSTSTTAESYVDILAGDGTDTLQHRLSSGGLSTLCSVVGDLQLGSGINAADILMQAGAHLGDPASGLEFTASGWRALQPTTNHKTPLGPTVAGSGDTVFTGSTDQVLAVLMTNAQATDGQSYDFWARVEVAGTGSLENSQTVSLSVKRKSGAWVVLDNTEATKTANSITVELEADASTGIRLLISNGSTDVVGVSYQAGPKEMDSASQPVTGGFSTATFDSWVGAPPPPFEGTYTATQVSTNGTGSGVALEVVLNTGGAVTDIYETLGGGTGYLVGETLVIRINVGGGDYDFNATVTAIS